MLRLLKKLSKKKNLITAVMGVVLILLWLSYLIFGSGEKKTELLILGFILPLVAYGFMRLTFKIVMTNASERIRTFAAWFFLISGTVGLIFVGLLTFIRDFPNGFSPVIGVLMGMMVAVLDEVR